MAELTWGTPLFFDLWAAGMAGGAFFAAFLLGLFGADRERRLLKAATYMAVPLVLLGVILIIADLGEPLRAFNMYVGTRAYTWQVIGGSGVNALRLWPPSLVLFPISPMSLGGWVLILFTVCGFALIALFLAQSAKAWSFDGPVGWGIDLLKALAPVATILSWVTFGLAILVMAYTGVVLATSSMELWNSTLLLPAVFVTSAICTGVAALMIVARLAGVGDDTVKLLRQALAILILVELAVLVAFVIWALVIGVAGSLVSGVVGLVFWAGAIALGLVVPLVLASIANIARQRLAVLASAPLVLLGGLLLRASVIIAGQL
jgi:formate-dependent nitrite reductase membrane component NrfD